MSKFERISTFIAVIEENGFAAAARKKGVTPAAVSRQISALEDELGILLLNRTTRQLSLTEPGEAYYQQCKKALNVLQEADDAISASRKNASGDLHIMTNRYFAETHLLPTLSEFIRRNPEVVIHFHLAENFPNFEKEGIDILFGVSIEGSPEWVRRKITTTRYILCASPHYLKKHGVPKYPKDLIKHQYITHNMRKPNNVIQFKDGKEIYLTPSLFVNDSYLMKTCALHDMGIVNLHDYMVANEIQDGTLVEVLHNHQESQKPIYLYYQKSKYLQPKIRKFIDFYLADS